MPMCSLEQVEFLDLNERLSCCFNDLGVALRISEVSAAQYMELCSTRPSHWYWYVAPPSLVEERDGGTTSCAHVWCAWGAG